MMPKFTAANAGEQFQFRFAVHAIWSARLSSGRQAARCT